MMGIYPPEQVIKVPFKTNNSFKSTIMALFLPVIVSKKNKQTKENMAFIACLSQIHINPEKTQKNTRMTSSDVPIYSLKIFRPNFKFKVCLFG